MLKTRLTSEEFLQYALAPENLHRRLELIDGEMIELVANDKTSEVGGIITTMLGGFVYPRRLGRVKGADGGYTIAGEQYIPDCSFVSYQRQPKTTTVSYPPIAPDLVVEVLSPGNLSSPDERDKLTHKVANYLKAGCELWLVYPDEEKLERCLPGEAVRTFRSGEVLEGQGVLAGFMLEISAIWPQ
jgi:Uma2 family endonuclease